MRQCMDAENLHRRLKKIIGQVQAIDRMVDEGIPCEGILSQIPQARFGEAADVAHAVAFLSGENAGYITGQVLCVDGGMAM